MSRPSISASSDAASSATAHLPDGSRSGPFDAPTDALRGPEPRGRHSRTSSNVSATSLGSGGALAAPRGQHGRKTSGGTKWTSFGQAVKSLSSRSQHTNLASLLDERERVTVEQLAAQPVSEPGPVQKSADLSLRSRTPSPDRVLRKDIERARVEPPETLRSDPVLGSKRRLDAEGVPDQPPGAPAGAQIPNWAASGTNLIESVSWDGDPRPAPLMVPPWQLPNEASQTSMLVSPDSLFNVTPATSASTSPSQTRNVTPMNSLGMGRALGSIPESPAVASAPFSLPMPSQSAPTAFHPFSGGLPPPSASEASPLTGGGSLSSSPRSQPRSGFPGLAPVKSRLDAIDVSDPFFLKLASETAKVSRTPAVPAAASGQKPARTSLEPEDALAPSASSSVPALPIPSVSPLSQQSPLSLSESSPRSPNISSETLKRSLAYRNYMEKRYGLLNEVVTSAAEAEGLPEGALPQNNPWNLADAIRFREQKQAGRGGKVKPDSRTKALLTPEIEEWHQHQVARRFLIRQRKQQQAEAAEALAQQALLEQQHTPETAAIPISKDLPSVSTKHPSSASSAYPVPTYVAYGPSDEFAVDDTGSETGRRTVSVKTGSPNHVPSSAQSPQKGLILASDMGSGTSSPAPRSASPSKGFVGQLSPSRNVRSLTKSAASDGGSPERDRLRGPSDVRSRSRESEGSLGSSAVAGTRERAVSGSLARSGAKAKEKDSDIDVSVRSASPLRPPGSDGDSMLFKRFLEGAGREPPQSGLTGSTGTRIASGGDQHRGSSRNSESKAGGLGAEDSLPDRTANRTMPPGALSLEREKRGSASRLTPIDTNFGTITRSPPGMPSSMPPKSSAGRRSYEFPPFQPVNVGFEEDDPMIYASAAPLVSMLIDTEKLAGVSDALFDGIDAAKSRFEKAGKKMFGALTFANARKRHRERTAGALDEGPEMEEGESGEPQGRRSLDLPSPGIGARPVPAQSWSVRLPGWPSSSGSTEPKSSRLGSDRIPVPRMSATTPDLGDSPPSDVTKLLPGNASASALQSLRTGTPQPQRSTSKPQLFRSATPQPTPSAPPASQTLPIMHLPGLLPVLKSRSFASISGPDHGEVGASGRFAWEDANQPGLLASSGHRDSSRNAMSDDEKDDAAESGRSRRSERPESRLRKKRSASMDNLPEIKELIQPQGTRDREQEKGEVFPGESEPQLLSESLKAGIEKKKPAGLLGIFRASSSTGRGSSSKREAGPPAEPDNVMIPTRLDSRDISEVRASGSATGALPERLHSIAEIDVGDSSVKDRVSAPATPDVELGAAEWPKPEQRWSRKDLNELELTLARQGSMLFADQSLKLANIRMPKDLQGISDRLETVTAGYEGMSGRIDTVASKVEQMLKLRQEAADLLSHLTSTPALPLLFGERIRPEHQRGPSHESFEGVGSSFARRHTSFSSFGEPSGLESRGTSPTRSLMNLTSFGAGTPAFGGCVRPMEDPGSVPPSPLSPELMRSQELRGRNRSGSGITFASEDVPLPDPATQTERLRAASEAASALLPRALAVQKQYHDLDVSIQQLSNKLSAWSDEVNKSWLPALHAAEEELERLEDRGRKQGQTWEEAGFLVLSWVLATLGSIIWIVYHAQVTMRASVKTGMDWAYGVLDRIGIADPLNRFWKELLESDAEAGRQLGPTMQRMPCSFGSQGQGQRTNAE